MSADRAGGAPRGPPLPQEEEDEEEEVPRPLRRPGRDGARPSRHPPVCLSVCLPDGRRSRARPPFLRSPMILCSAGFDRSADPFGVQRSGVGEVRGIHGNLSDQIKKKHVRTSSLL